MSKQKQKCDSLPKLQHRIVLCLAKKEPMNIRQTNSKLKGEYTSTNRGFHELLKKGFIQKVNVQEYRGRQFDKFWLSDKGLIYAIHHESNLNVLLPLVEKIYGQKSMESLLVRLTSVLGPKAFRFVHTLISQHGLTEESLNAIINTALVNATMFTNKKPKVLVKQILEVLKDYPEFYQLYKQAYRNIKNEIKSLSEIVEKEGVES